jgi:hypothetical protein
MGDGRPAGVDGEMAVWIERVDGTIVRGVALAVSSLNARVRLSAAHAFRRDEDVMLRICFSPDRPTVAASAHVRWSRPVGDAVECGLDWHLLPGPSA